MAATKDVVMEPTLKSLNDDLVITNFIPGVYVNTSGSSLEGRNIKFSWREGVPYYIWCCKGVKT